MQTRRGLGPIDVAIVVVMIAFITMTIAAAAARSRETAYRVKCASNLRQIGVALQLYTRNHGEWPRTRYASASADRPTFWTAPSSTTPFASTGPAVNDITAAYRLLLAHEALVPEVFLCPTSPVANLEFALNRFKRDHANFIDERELSYSFANPYPTEPARVNGYALTQSLSDTFAVASDVNPGQSGSSGVLSVTSTSSARDTRPANSPNHDRDGQNVLYGDGHVDFLQNPFVGHNRDNIYTFDRKGDAAISHGIIGSPADAGDTVLLPAMDSDLWQRERVKRHTTTFALIAGAAVCVVAFSVLVWRTIRAWSSRRRRYDPSAI